MTQASRKTGSRFNIGTAIFGAIGIYLIITLVLYATRKDVRTYMVTSGTLSGNETYTAIAVRSEILVKATSGGYLNYYTSDGSKSGKDEAVCSISSTKVHTETVEPGAATLQRIRKQLAQYASYYSGDEFERTYDLGYALDSMLIRSADSSSVVGSVYRAPSDGVVCTSTDGYESMTAAGITAADFNTDNYRKRQLRTEEAVSAGDPIYRLIESEVWSIVFPVSDRQRVQLESRDTIKILFEKDQNTETGDLHLFEKDGQAYAQVTFENGMVRYAADRFLEIELVTNTRSGLKIPLSSVVRKEFYTIPASYMTYGGENDSAGFMTERRDEEGNVTTVHVSTTLYEKQSEDGEESSAVYYVDKADFREGDVIVPPDTNTRYPIGPTAELEGVYCVNKGYAVFRKIVILDQNEEYCIVESGVDYGIAQFDYIVQNGQDVAEEEILY